MRFKASLIAAALLLIAGTPNARAQGETWGPDSRDFLFSLNGSYSHVSDELLEQEAFNIFTGVGYFAGRKHEFGATIQGTYRAFKGFGDAYDFGIFPYYNFNLPVSDRTTLYAGPHVGYVDGTSSAGEFAYGAQIGIRQWISPRVSLNLEPRYTHVDYPSNQSGSQDNIVVLFGINVVL